MTSACTLPIYNEVGVGGLEIWKLTSLARAKDSVEWASGVFWEAYRLSQHEFVVRMRAQAESGSRICTGTYWRVNKIFHVISFVKSG